MGTMPASIPDVLEPPQFSKSSCKKQDVLKRSKKSLGFIKDLSNQEFIATGNIAAVTVGGKLMFVPAFATGINWIGKFDAAKKPLWQYCFPKRSGAPMPDETIQDMIVTSDGGYLGIGQSTFGRSGVVANGWVFKLNVDGELEWQKLYGRTFDKNFSAVSLISVMSTPDQGFIIVGSLNQRITTSSCTICDRRYALLMKLNTDGELQWQKSYGMDFEVSIYPQDENGKIKKESTEGGFSFKRIFPVADGGFFVTGTTNIFASNDTWFARFDSEGNVLWQKAFGKEKANEIRNIREDHERNLVIAGMLTLGFSQPWALKLDPNGKVLWQKILGKSSNVQVFDVVESVDQKGYVFIGRTRPSRAQSIQDSLVPQTLWIFQLDTNGKLVWQKGYLSIFDTYSVDLRRFADGYLLRSDQDFFPIDSQGGMKKSRSKIFGPVKVNFPSKEFTQEEVETDIHDYEIPISEE